MRKQREYTVLDVKNKQLKGKHATKIDEFK